MKPKPDFRVIKKGMKVKEMFDLVLAPEWYKPSEKFISALKKVTRACPCCPRGTNPLPPTKLVHLTYRLGSEDGTSSDPQNYPELSRINPN